MNLGQQFGALKIIEHFSHLCYNWAFVGQNYFHNSAEKHFWKHVIRIFAKKSILPQKIKNVN